MNILITGGTGFVGSALSKSLVVRQHRLFIISRADHPPSDNVSYYKQVADIPKAESVDVVINLAGEPIADKRWSVKRKAKIVDSRIETTKNIIDYCRQAQHEPQLVISASAIGYYGVGIDEQSIDEAVGGDNSFSSELCRQWEEVASAAASIGIRTCVLRIGIVLGKSGGALQKMLPAFRIGLGGKIGSGLQWMSWIHIDDLIGIIEYCMNNPSIDGPINCTAPNPVTNNVWTRLLGEELKRPTFFTMPALMVELLFGDMGRELLLSGKKVVPKKLTDAGYSFQFENLEQAFADVVASSS